MELVKLEDITKEDFQTFDSQEDYILQADCEVCGESYDEEVEECAVCGSDDIINETAHEGLKCEACRHYFDMWEDIVVGRVGDEPVAICNACYEKLEELLAQEEQ